jgi:hypothetical protein
MAGLVPAIHVSSQRRNGVDARHKQAIGHSTRCGATAWMPGTRPGMTNFPVIAGLVPAIHVSSQAALLNRGCPAQGRA